ncbi:uncharacterized protein VTP21DRAFT_1089 [Calcarisporiella thermophila]|uniref:uncharacterized protein n=1 Tax=Calcarisporiella thermophila TaxID=911321 RepID=UPI003742EC20
MIFEMSVAEILLNFASIFFALLMMIIVIRLRFVRPSVAGNISFTLSFWIGLADALFRITYLLFMAYDFNDTIPPSSGYFRFLLWTIYFFPIWFSLLTVSIAFDLQLSFIQGKMIIRQYQKWYLPVSTIVSFAATTPQLFYGNVWWNSEYDYISSDWPYEIDLLSEVLRSVITFGSIMYSIIIICISLHKVFETIRKMEKDRVKKFNNRKLELQVIVSVMRVLGYPLVLIICMPAETILGILFVTHNRYTPFGDATQTAKNITSGMQGILNFIVFLFNPSFTQSLSGVPFFKDIWLFQERTCPYTGIGALEPHEESRQIDTQNISAVREVNTSSNPEQRSN